VGAGTRISDSVGLMAGSARQQQEAGVGLMVGRMVGSAWLEKHGTDGGEWQRLGGRRGTDGGNDGGKRMAGIDGGERQWLGDRRGRNDGGKRMAAKARD
jgi:hypothetical protein